MEFGPGTNEVHTSLVAQGGRAGVIPPLDRHARVRSRRRPRGQPSGGACCWNDESRRARAGDNL
eukprot:13197904-Heterocapsa_arctica.AAC.1